MLHRNNIIKFERNMFHVYKVGTTQCVKQVVGMLLFSKQILKEKCQLYIVVHARTYCSMFVVLLTVFVKYVNKNSHFLSFFSSCP